MNKKTRISQEDIDAFYKSLKGIKPLTKEKVRLADSRPKKTAHKKIKEHEKIVFADSDDHEPVTSESFLTYKHDSISGKILRKLRKGQYTVDAKLDLHGMSVEQARSAVQKFLTHSLDENKRVVLIIHGKGVRKGMPVLKNKLNHWLRSTLTVLAFCSAATQHGSRGATYVLLKRLS